jgi:hypothetical protein
VRAFVVTISLQFDSTKDSIGIVPPVEIIQIPLLSSSCDGTGVNSYNKGLVLVFSFL